MKMFVMKLLLKMHNLIYVIISSYSVRIHGGKHPKHDLMKYYDFFVQNIKKTDKVLDIGCGGGFLAKKVVQKTGVKIVAVDFDPVYLGNARKNSSHKNIEYILCDATTYDFKKKFDKIILSNVLEHIEKRVEFLKKIKHLSPTILIRVPMFDRGWMPLYKKKLGIDYRLDPTHEIEYTEKIFRDEMQKAGLKIDSLYVRFGEIYAVVKV